MKRMYLGMPQVEVANFTSGLRQLAEEVDRDITDDIRLVARVRIDNRLAVGHHSRAEESDGLKAVEVVPAGRHIPGSRIWSRRVVCSTVQGQTSANEPKC